MPHRQPLKTNVFPGGRGDGTWRRNRRTWLQTGCRTAASVIPATLTRDSGAFAEVTGLRGFVFTGGEVYTAKENSRSVRAGRFHTPRSHHLHAVRVLVTDYPRLSVTGRPQGTGVSQRLFNLVESLNIHETIKLCYLKVPDEV